MLSHFILRKFRISLKTPPKLGHPWISAINLRKSGILLNETNHKWVYPYTRLQDKSEEHTIFKRTAAEIAIVQDLADAVLSAMSSKSSGVRPSPEILKNPTNLKWKAKNYYLVLLQNQIKWYFLFPFSLSKG